MTRAHAIYPISGPPWRSSDVERGGGTPASGPVISDAGVSAQDATGSVAGLDEALWCARLTSRLSGYVRARQRSASRARGARR